MNKLDIILSKKSVNIKAMIYTIIVGGVSLAIYLLLWGNNLDFGFDVLFKLSVLNFIGIVLHEAIHVISFMWIGKVRKSDVKFGFMWKYLTPYVHCNSAISKRAYQYVLLLPVILTGFLPMIIGLLTGNSLLVFTSILLISGGGGDWLIFKEVRAAKKYTFVQDHPTEIGCVMYK